MATNESAHMTIAAGPGPGSVVVRVHGVLDLPENGAGSLLQDRDVLAIRVDLHDDVEAPATSLAMVDALTELGQHPCGVQLQDSGRDQP